jgi:hypothetical protein
MNKRVIEIIVDQTFLEFLDEIQYPTIEFPLRASVVLKWFLCLNVTVQNLLCKDVFLVQEQHN